MKRTIAIITAFLLAFTVCLQTTCVSASELSDLDKEIKQKKQELKEGKKERKELMESLVDLEETIGQLDNQIASASEKLEVLKKELRIAKKKVQEQDKSLNKRLRNMYKNGSVGFLDVLLNSGSFSEFLTNLDMVQRILKSDEKVLANLKKSHRQIAKKKKEVEQLQAELEQAQLTAQAERNDVSAQKKELEKANAQTADDIGDLEAEREELERELAAKSANGEISNSGSSKYTGGAFQWPLPASYTVTSNYGWRMCPFHGREFHAAIDIGGAPSGSTIVAAAKGKVIHSGWYGGFGNSVIIDHGGGLSSQYNHCSAVLVSAGQKVKKGQAIAQLGSTGYSTGPHLDFRVYRDGSAVSPWEYLQ